MKGMAMRRVFRRLDCIRTPKENIAGIESDKEDICAPPSVPLLAKRMRTSTNGGRVPPSSPLLAKRTRQQATSNGDGDSPLSNSRIRNPLGCVAFGKRRKSLVTLVVGKERQVFKVEPHMLEHRLLECLLARTTSSPSISTSSSSPDALWEEKENVVVRNRRGSQKLVRLDCDVILFEHILWLLNNDDPAVRHLKIEELMEFYE